MLYLSILLSGHSSGSAISFVLQAALTNWGISCNHEIKCLSTMAVDHTSLLYSKVPRMPLFQFGGSSFSVLSTVQIQMVHTYVLGFADFHTYVLVLFAFTSPSYQFGISQERCVEAIHAE